MWNDPLPKWRTARKQYQCEGDGCSEVIAPGERYLDKAEREPANSHKRYCQECAETVLDRASGHHMFRGRSDFGDRYQQRISSTGWKLLKSHVIELRGHQCEGCGQPSASLELHHLHYRSLGCEQPADVELLCGECHANADKARAGKGSPKTKDPDEGMIVGLDGDYWGKFDPDTIYIPLEDGRHLPLSSKRQR